MNPVREGRLGEAWRRVDRRMPWATVFSGLHGDHERALILRAAPGFATVATSAGAPSDHKRADTAQCPLPADACASIVHVSADTCDQSQSRRRPASTGGVTHG